MDFDALPRDHALTRLIRRLEAATSRLEDIASSTGEDADGANAVRDSGTASKAPSVNGDNTNTRSLAIAPARRPSAPPSVEAFDGLVSKELVAFSNISNKLGGVVAEQCNAFCMAFRAQGDVILIASKAKEPAQTSPVYQDILKELIMGIQEIQSIRDKNRKSAQEDHLSVITDGAGILSWLTMRPSPDKYVAEVLGGAQFYGNKILSANKGKESKDVDWVKAFVKLCGGLVQYIKEYHPKGMEWNSTGVIAEEALREVKEGSKADGAATGGAPPPPPPPPLPQFDSPPPPPQPGAKNAPPSGGDMGSVFAELNRGGAVTSSLRKVDKSEMTHKNPALRANTTSLERSDSASSTRSKSPNPPTKKSKPESMRTKKQPRKELDGNKWIIENYENVETSPIRINAEKHQSILILKCKTATIKVNGKANAISVDNCSRVDLLIDSLVSSVDVTNTNNFRMQVLGTLPSVQFDKVDAGTLYLSPESLETEVYTSKCTSINITLPPKGDYDDSVECPVPEQIRTRIVEGKLVHEIVKQEG